MTHARACRVLGSSKPPIDVLASDRRATEVRLTDQGWQAITDASEGRKQAQRERLTEIEAARLPGRFGIER